MKKILMFIALAAAAAGCAGQKEFAPLDDGLFFEYEYKISGPVGGSVILIKFDFSRTEDYNYLVTVSTEDKRTGKKSEVQGKIPVDMYLQTEKGKEFMFPMLGQLWIPPSRRRKGSKISTGKVAGEKEWKGRKLLAVSGNSGIKMTYYYDKDTGFLFGHSMSHMGAGSQAVLVNTNAKGFSF